MYRVPRELLLLGRVPRAVVVRHCCCMRCMRCMCCMCCMYCTCFYVLHVSFVLYVVPVLYVLYVLYLPYLYVLLCIVCAVCVVCAVYAVCGSSSCRSNSNSVRPVLQKPILNFPRPVRLSVRRLLPLLRQQRLYFFCVKQKYRDSLYWRGNDCRLTSVFRDQGDEADGITARWTAALGAVLGPGQDEEEEEDAVRERSRQHPVGATRRVCLCCLCCLCVFTAGVSNVITSCSTRIVRSTAGLE